jgi:diacylglycerol kinase family enzyme
VCDDGLLDIVIFQCRNLLQLLYLFILAFTGRTAKSSLIRHFKGKEFVVSTPGDNVKTQIDGDPGPKMPLNIKVIPASLCLLAP